MIKFLSIDSSLANTGIAAGVIDPETLEVKVNDVDLLETKKSQNKQVRASSDTIERCGQTFAFIKRAIIEYEPQVIFAETPSGSQSASGMKSYGATCQLLGSVSPSPIQVTPDEVKKGSVGDKKASKEKIINWAYGLYPQAGWDLNRDGTLKKKNEHMADAVAAVFAGIRTDEFKRLIGLMVRI